jgi:nucleotide-binding universal stress UspA family protein
MYKRILVPVDGSATSRSGLTEAIRIAKATGARLRVLHVLAGVRDWGTSNAATADAEMFRADGKKLMDDVLARLRKEKVQAEGKIVRYPSGRAADAIIREANRWPADVIVMGTHGRRGFNRLIFGSDAQIVLHSVTMPVLLVRDSGKRRAGARRKA